MRSTRVGAILDQLRLDLRLRRARRLERAALALLGDAAASGTAPADFAVAQLVEWVWRSGGGWAIPTLTHS
jgi:hypothetical protein